MKGADKAGMGRGCARSRVDFRFDVHDAEIREGHAFSPADQAGRLVWRGRFRFATHGRRPAVARRAR